MTTTLESLAQRVAALEAHCNACLEITQQGMRQQKPSPIRDAVLAMTPCGICGTPVLRTSLGGVAEYHDCKPVPGAMLDAARAEINELKDGLVAVSEQREKALADLATMKERAEKAETMLRMDRQACDEVDRIHNALGVPTQHIGDPDIDAVGAIARLYLERDTLRDELAATKEQLEDAKREYSVRHANCQDALARAEKAEAELAAERERIRTVTQTLGKATERTTGGLEHAAQNILADLAASRAWCAELEGLLREAYSCVYYARDKQTEKAPYDNLIARIDAGLAGKEK